MAKKLEVERLFPKEKMEILVNGIGDMLGMSELAGLNKRNTLVSFSTVILFC